MREKYTPGAIGISKGATTIALHPIASGVKDDIIETKHSLSIYSIMNDEGRIKQITSINMTEDTMRVLHDTLCAYISQVNDNKLNELEDIDAKQEGEES
ncbi:MAG: hypothetical protein HOG49_26765 [Candidatus Scalindua sp.]|jgi:hypothetical protein|nr:hypothetical protein [Candidatus Scalindua sp.]